ncbi:hypothetical protein [Nocardia jejuensis]|uniref:hypothetical protein n=1 Tax=Nocardia jejuensis TaxID=328049 RepID=UPI0012FBEC7B|nr:hypothetical protein [Nocardia jejuensis]
MPTDPVLDLDVALALIKEHAECSSRTCEAKQYLTACVLWLGAKSGCDIEPVGE